MIRNLQDGYFILGKNLRRQRKSIYPNDLPDSYWPDVGYNPPPCKEEIQAFETVYKLSSKAIYGIYMADMLEDKTEIYISQPLNMKKEILITNPDNVPLMLRLAFGFIRRYSFYLAKQCLLSVRIRTPEFSTYSEMYLHCRNIYLDNRQRYEVNLILLSI